MGKPPVLLTTVMDFVDRARGMLVYKVENGAAEIILPGLVQSEADSHGVMSIWKLSSVFEAGRVIALRTLNLGNMRSHLGKGASMFVRQVRYNISPKLSIPLSSLRNSTIKVTVRLLTCGTTSLTMEEVLSEVETEAVLGTVELRYVYVDMISRKSKPLPTVIRQQIPSEASTEDSRYVHPDPPKNTFTWTVPVENHHIDGNQHTNQSRYLQFCWDAAMAAARQGYFTGIPPDSVKFSVSDITALYDGESVEGDILTVTTWSDDSIQCIYFNIDLRNKRIFRCCWILRQL